MTPDVKTVEQLVEIITREVLIAMAEQQQRVAAPEAGSASSIAPMDCVYALALIGPGWWWTQEQRGFRLPLA